MTMKMAVSVLLTILTTAIPARVEAQGEEVEAAVEDSGQAVPQPPVVHRRIAVTVDDLPIADMWQHTSPRVRQDIITNLCRIFQSRGIPVTGFFNMSQHEEDSSLLPLWQECGIQLGNHTWSHPKLREVGLEAFVEDLERGHRALAAFVEPGTPIPFRYPYLNEGFSPEDRDTIRARLTELSSPIAPVTIDTWDWLYSRGYREALREGDQALADRYRQSWWWNLEESTEYAEHLSRELFGREPPQILLLHGNQINADHLEEFLDWLEARGYEFVSLEEALSDPAYAEEDTSLSPTGDSHWLRLRRSRELRGR